MTLVGDAHTTEDLTEYGAPPPDQVIAHTNLYWKYHSAPGRTAGVADTAEVSFDGAPDACGIAWQDPSMGERAELVGMDPADHAMVAAAMARLGFAGVWDRMLAGAAVTDALDRADAELLVAAGILSTDDDRLDVGT